MNNLSRQLVGMLWAVMGYLWSGAGGIGIDADSRAGLSLNEYVGHYKYLSWWTWKRYLV